MLQQGRTGWAAATVVTHLAGSLIMTFGGYHLMSRIVS